MSFIKSFFRGGYNSHGGYGGGHGHGSKHGRYEAPYYGAPQQMELPVATVQNCPDCRRPQAIDARFCNNCGLSLVPSQCSSCNQSLMAGAKFCGNCGQQAAT